MKKLLIIILLLSIFLISCTKVVSADTIDSTTAKTTIITETTINNSNNTINYDYNNLKAEYDKLVEDKQKLEDENKAYDYLIRNLNNLLRNVYYGYASNDKYILDGFTAFSIYYKGKYYLITAGHCVEQEGQIFSNHKFKANFSDEWIYPKLLDYKYNGNTSDYAIFYSDKIDNGFVKYGDNIEGKKYILGTTNNKLNVLREFTADGINGECGSPIINLNQEVVGVYYGTTSITSINIILEAIDNLK